MSPSHSSSPADSKSSQAKKTETKQTEPKRTEPAERCDRCEKPKSHCVCEAIVSKTPPYSILILQHPQEPDEVMGTGKLTELSLEGAQLKVGLSWRNLSQALGTDASPQDWVVLYLGSYHHPKSYFPKTPELFLADQKGAPLARQNFSTLQGIILLDGTWSQAKTLWWRNPWLLKCKRGILIPHQKSLYGTLRKEPRREGLSTIESAGMALSALTGEMQWFEDLVRPFSLFLNHCRKQPLRQRSSKARRPFRRNARKAKGSAPRARGEAPKD